MTSTSFQNDLDSAPLFVIFIRQSVSAQSNAGWHQALRRSAQEPADIGDPSTPPGQRSGLRGTGPDYRARARIANARWWASALSKCMTGISDDQAPALLREGDRSPWRWN